MAGNQEILPRVFFPILHKIILPQFTAHFRWFGDNGCGHFTSGDKNQNVLPSSYAVMLNTFGFMKYEIKKVSRRKRTRS
jgi:hypothetical protein